jgi:hypothetical protein
MPDPAYDLDEQKETEADDSPGQDPVIVDASPSAPSDEVAKEEAAPREVYDRW